MGFLLGWSTKTTFSNGVLQLLDRLIPYSEQILIKDLIFMDLFFARSCLLFELCISLVLDLLFALLLIEWNGLGWIL